MLPRDCEVADDSGQVSQLGVGQTGRTTVASVETQLQALVEQGARPIVLSLIQGNVAHREQNHAYVRGIAGQALYVQTFL